VASVSASTDSATAGSASTASEALAGAFGPNAFVLDNGGTSTGGRSLGLRRAEPVQAGRPGRRFSG
jgi:hypothetical protein